MTKHLLAIGYVPSTIGRTALGLFVGSFLFTQGAFAQDTVGVEQADVDADDTRSDGEEKTDSESDSLRPDLEDHAEERPEPPGGTVLHTSGDTMEVDDPTVIAGAGMGSDIAYATRGVVELGGIMGLDVREETIDFTIAPTVGYFVVDRLELTLMPLLRVRSVEDDTGDSQTNTRFAVIVEPSYHLPFMDNLYGFIGTGLGLTYESGPGVEFLFRPVAGVDIMIGRSGILKPALFLDVGLDAGSMGGGVQVGYTVML